MRSRDAAERVPYCTIDHPAAAVAGNLLGEVLVHGVDLARATGAEVALDAGHAYLALVALTTGIPFALTEHGRNASTILELRAKGYPAAQVHLAAGSTRITDAPGSRPDIRFSGTPQNLLLSGHGRLLATVMLTGKVRVSGRRPWRALTIDKAFDTA